ncbi:cytochrome b/b6 domain-containing protein [Paracoccus sp. p4-l81]|uniref:cytochrome b/b6 domain-containing protein n=1 Tax=unclassified Paracoccus (in: a-proteobacteria) TaxID=2688777 RepID=UPI0035BA2A62
MMDPRDGNGANRPADVEHVKLWDPLLRGFHWLLASLVIITWALGKFGPNVMTLHFWFAYAIIALLVLRLIWGLVGPAPARFTHFLKGPGAVLSYARHMFRREPSYWPGHNPMGGWAVVLIVAILGYQLWTGLIMDPDDYVNVGPLASEVSAATRKAARGWHHTGANLVLAIVALHVAIIAFYKLWKREDLIRPMLTGWKWVRRR